MSPNRPSTVLTSASTWPGFVTPQVPASTCAPVRRLRFRLGMRWPGALAEPVQGRSEFFQQILLYRECIGRRRPCGDCQDTLILTPGLDVELWRRISMNARVRQQAGAKLGL